MLCIKMIGICIVFIAGDIKILIHFPIKVLSLLPKNVMLNLLLCFCSLPLDMGYLPHKELYCVALLSSLSLAGFTIKQTLTIA